MIAAKNKAGERVSIDYAIKGEPYFCPICNQPLIQKHGEIRQPHFAHVGTKKGYPPCRDSWNYDKTDWHIKWQKRFPDFCYEKVVTHGDEKHIADVLVNNLVIEFQHSSISLEDFTERNRFYTSCGYKVVWVFDLTEEREDGKITNPYRENEYMWSYPKKLFREMNFKEVQATIYFQFDSSDDPDTGVLERVTGGYNRFTTFYTDNKRYLSIPEFVKYISKDEQKVIPPKVQKPAVPDAVNGGKTIYDLWEQKFSGMVVLNMVTGKEMIINGKNGEMYRQNRNPSGKIIGKYSNKGPDNKYRYSDYYPVWDADKAVWSLKKSFISNDYLENERIDKEIAELNIAGDTLWHLTLFEPTDVYFCLYNNKYYYFEFINSSRFNAYEFDPASGEIHDECANELLHKLSNKHVWKVYHPKEN